MNCTVNDVDWPGFKVAGRLPETILKPLPEIDAALTVNAELPEDVSVTVLVAAVFTVKEPKERLDGLTVN